jgi:hypothetical protein
MVKWLRTLLVVVAASVPMLALDGEAAAKGKGGKGSGKATAAVVDAKFNRWLITPHGQIGGILLDNGGVVRVHNDAVKDTSLKSGDALHIDGKTKGKSVYMHTKITKGTAVVVDDTVKHAKGAGKPKGAKLNDMTAASKVNTLISGPGGKTHAVILDDGTIAYAPHKSDLATFSLKKGDAVTVTGKGGNYTLGRAMVITSIKLPNGDVKTL